MPSVNVSKQKPRLMPFKLPKKSDKNPSANRSSAKRKYWLPGSVSSDGNNTRYRRRPSFPASRKINKIRTKPNIPTDPFAEEKAN
ncbi:hypothetical protein AVEN_172715-1 [Araneus ventricosus]|uniref:Uncharacterized protein n=1 Tax=Araneus ventricosus TaxID=182803 RepID=A0A4Y2U0G9_ARAVE|nr:hypothetical protein AVEN_122732-1 [Araneus ventricosus]GBO06005.1 hypothetical protein AVEN_172715-1 [Araneus ventricosus]